MTQAVHDQSATIVVRRPPAVWRDALRSYVVDVDGHKGGRIGGGSELAVSVSPGHHVVRARIDWTGSPAVELVLEAGEQAVLCVEPAGSVFRIDQIIGTERYLRLTHLG